MKSWVIRGLVSASLAIVCWMVVAGAATSTKTPILEPGKLIILSTTDVKGKVAPCG